MTINPVLVEVERSGFVESRHRGAAIGLDAGGAVAVRAGDPAAPVFPRSANKPLQAVAMLRSGLELDEELLALAAGSHSGEDFHMEGVEKILSGAGLVAADLRCPESWPLDPATQHDIARTGRGPSRPRMNCSGKHAAMLATCVTAGWPTGTYLDPGHPLQRAVRDVVEEMAGEDVTAVGVDGCGAPLFAVSIAGVARAFRALVLAGPGTAERRVADAMRTHPQWTSGTRREELRLMEAVPGLLVKCGAEGWTRSRSATAAPAPSRSTTGRCGRGRPSPWRCCGRSASTTAPTRPPWTSWRSSRSAAATASSAPSAPPQEPSTPPQEPSTSRPEPVPHPAGERSCVEPR